MNIKRPHRPAISIESWDKLTKIAQATRRDNPPMLEVIINEAYEKWERDHLEKSV